MCVRACAVSCQLCVLPPTRRGCRCPAERGVCSERSCGQGCARGQAAGRQLGSPPPSPLPLGASCACSRGFAALGERRSQLRPCLVLPGRAPAWCQGRSGVAAVSSAPYGRCRHQAPGFLRHPQACSLAESSAGSELCEHLWCPCRCERSALTRRQRRVLAPREAVSCLEACGAVEQASSRWGCAGSDTRVPWPQTPEISPARRTALLEFSPEGSR